MKTKQQIMAMLEINKDYYNKYKGEKWFEELSEILKRQMSVLEWILDIEEEDDENRTTDKRPD